MRETSWRRRHQRSSKGVGPAETVIGEGVRVSRISSKEGARQSAWSGGEQRLGRRSEVKSGSGLSFEGP